MSVAFKDGKFVENSKSSVPFNDSGFANGLGIFDSLLAKNGDLVYAEDHFQRISYDTAIVLRLKFAMEEGEWREICCQLLEQNGLSGECARVKTIVTGGVIDAPIQTSGKPSIIMTVAPCPAPETVSPASCAIITVSPEPRPFWPRPLTRMKYPRFEVKVNSNGPRDAFSTASAQISSSVKTSEISSKSLIHQR